MIGAESLRDAYDRLCQVRDDVEPGDGASPEGVCHASDLIAASGGVDNGGACEVAAELAGLRWRRLAQDVAESDWDSDGIESELLSALASMWLAGVLCGRLARDDGE